MLCRPEKQNKTKTPEAKKRKSQRAAQGFLLLSKGFSLCCVSALWSGLAEQSCKAGLILMCQHHRGRGGGAGGSGEAPWPAGGGGGSHRCVPEPHGPRAEKAKGSQVLVLGEAREAAAGTTYFAQQSQSISLHILSAVLTPFCQQAEVWSPPLISSYPSCPQSVLNIVRADFFFF